MKIMREWLALGLLMMTLSACDRPRDIAVRAGRALQADDYKSYSALFGHHGWGSDYFADEKGFAQLKVILSGLNLKLSEAKLFKNEPDESYSVQKTFVVAVTGTNARGESAEILQIFVREQKTARGTVIFDGYPDGMFIQRIEASERGCDKLHSPEICAAIVLPPRSIYDRNSP